VKKLIEAIKKIERQQAELEEKRIKLLEQLHGKEVMGFKISVGRDRGKRYLKAHAYVEGKKHCVHIGHPKDAEAKIGKYLKEKGMSKLESIFDNLSWERKFEHQVPDRNILFAFREKDADKATKKLTKLEEEDHQKNVVRVAYLGSDSLGQVLCVTEEEWDE